MDVRLHIERLVLDGLAVTPAQRTSLVRTLQSELGRLIAAGGVSDRVAAGISVPSLSGGTSVVVAPFDPAAFGQSLAQAVYDGLGKPRR